MGEGRWAVFTQTKAATIHNIVNRFLYLNTHNAILLQNEIGI
jgi:hypothetical protein